MSRKSERIYMEVVSIEEDKQLECISECEEYKDCWMIGHLKLGTRDASNLKFSHVYLIIHNTLNRKICIRDEYFTAIDNDGFSHKGCELSCDYYARRKSSNIHDYDLPAGAKVRFLVLFQAKTISKIIYDESFYGDCNIRFSLNLKDISVSEDNESVWMLKQKIYERTALIDDLKKDVKNKDKTIASLENEIKEVSKERNMFQQAMRERGGWRDAIKRSREDLLIKYEIIEDENYYRIISLEKEDTVSFNREFDKTKGNYNWINEGDALISLKADNAFGYNMDGRTIIKSPVSGIFEFNNNKMIGYKEEICRIKKYPMEMKNQIIEDLEKKEIKENVYKKERKKILERQVLDELIEEGKVFNAYTKKDGNRTTIPMDVANAVWNRDGGKCCICGSKENLEFDHIIPISKGGATTFRNLQILCKNCNIRKSDNI
ncbi:HNH endonuclease [Bacteroides thetaiotaomicron]|uniref:HNH endonuclease n=1 Tax=Bacteroides thetaiotaomicron TaxID=818 RepID=UPI0034A454A7